MKSRHLLALCAGAAVGGLAAPAMAATSCESLAQLHAPGVTITVAKTASAAAEISPALAQAGPKGPLCRVGGYITPTPDSHIGFEVWLPATETWNRKLEAVGNGGLSGALNYRAMVGGFSRGYAAMTTDLGHTNTPPNAVEDPTWALGHPEKVIDYSYRAEHLSTLAAKQIIEAYYGIAPAHAYYTGCSAGGIQGLNEALRYPSDFDGYIVGDATPDHMGQEMGAMWNTLAASLADPANALKAPEINLVHKAVLAQCAGKDGGLASDPFLTDPSACKFDPKALQCAPGQAAGSCLSPAQVAIFQKIYQGPVDPRTHKPFYSGMSVGSEAGWDRYFVGKTNPAGPDRPWGGFLAYMVYDPSYLSQQKYLTFDFGKDYDAVRQAKAGGETFESSWTVKSRNLDPIRAAGGKVIQYHGWDDPNIPSLEAVAFHKAVVADQAQRRHLTPQQAEAETQKFYRLFMAPGMGHCNGGDGPSNFGQNGQRPLKDDAEHDMLIALEQWVEKGAAPERFIGSRVDAKTSAVDMTRPICAYPKVPVWNGSGPAAEASSFACAERPTK
jgi:feruloyl esterase